MWTKAGKINTKARPHAAPENLQSGDGVHVRTEHCVEKENTSSDFLNNGVQTLALLLSSALSSPASITVIMK